MISPSTLQSIRDRIEQARSRSGLENKLPVEIVAVTKGFPAEVIVSAYDAGLRTIGENRVQEAIKKFTQLDKLPGLKKRLIGHLQSNKVRKAIEMFDWIDSVDSMKLAKKLSNIAVEKNVSIPILLEVNSAGDPAKFGFRVDQTDEMHEIINLPALKVGGLMTIGALTDDKSRIRETFRSLRKLREDLNHHLRGDMRVSELSMGMTADFEIAVEEGATMVRIGTALFGPRPN